MMEKPGEPKVSVEQRLIKMHSVAQQMTVWFAVVLLLTGGIALGQVRMGAGVRQEPHHCPS